MCCLALLLLCVSCVLRPQGAREKYLKSLERDVDSTAAEIWRSEGDSALRRPLALELPYAESLGLRDAPIDSAAVVFDVSVTSPLELQLVVRPSPGTRGGLVVDVLEAVDDGADGSDPSESAERIAHFDPGALDERIALPSSTGVRRLLVRVQPVVGSTGDFDLAMATRTPLSFPVATESRRAVGSLFGDPRDGGSRQHHGIDIFAPRDTAVVAAASGRIQRIGNSARGGLHIWQRSDVGSLYYAHLESVEISRGARVQRGQVIGRVGNSGNASTTAPHLHFGLYGWDGPRDPLPWVGRSAERPLDFAGVETFGGPRRVASDRLNLRAGPGTSYEVLKSLESGDGVQVEAALEGWARVSTPDGERGFVASRFLR